MVFDPGGPFESLFPTFGGGGVFGPAARAKLGENVAQGLLASAQIKREETARQDELELKRKQLAQGERGLELEARKLTAAESAQAFSEKLATAQLDPVIAEWMDPTKPPRAYTPAEQGQIDAFKIAKAREGRAGMLDAVGLAKVLRGADGKPLSPATLYDTDTDELIIPPDAQLATEFDAQIENLTTIFGGDRAKAIRFVAKATEAGFKAEDLKNLLTEAQIRNLDADARYKDAQAKAEGADTGRTVPSIASDMKEAAVFDLIVDNLGNDITKIDANDLTADPGALMRSVIGDLRENPAKARSMLTSPDAVAVAKAMLLDEARNAKLSTDQELANLRAKKQAADAKAGSSNTVADKAQASRLAKLIADREAELTATVDTDLAKKNVTLRPESKEAAPQEVSLVDYIARGIVRGLRADAASQDIRLNLAMRSPYAGAGRINPAAPVTATPPTQPTQPPVLDAVRALTDSITKDFVNRQYGPGTQLTVYP